MARSGCALAPLRIRSGKLKNRDSCKSLIFNAIPLFTLVPPPEKKLHFLTFSLENEENKENRDGMWDVVMWDGLAGGGRELVIGDAVHPVNPLKVEHYIAPVLILHKDRLSWFALAVRLLP